MNLNYLYEKSLRLLEKNLKKLKNTNEWSFVVVGDTHLFYEGTQCRNGLNNLIKLFKNKELDPLFIIHTGDTIHKRSESRMEKFIELLEKDPLLNEIPIFVSIGNHDRIGSFKCIGDTWAFNKYIGPNEYYIDVCNTRFIFLCNTGHVEHDKEYMGFSARYLQRNLNKIIENGRDKGIEEFFIIMHIPPCFGLWKDGTITDNHTFSKGSKEFIRIVEENKDYIKGIFCGHIHGYGMQTLNNVPVFVTGGGGGLLCKGFNETIDHHFMKVSINKDKKSTFVSFTLYEI